MSVPEVSKQIDVSTMYRKQTLSVTEESPAEQAARLTEEGETARHRRKMETVKTVSLALSLASVGAVCLWLILSSANEKNVEWARSVLTAIVTGTVGYLTGQKSGKHSADE